MTTAAHIDFETGSACDLRKCGAYVYAAHETTRVWLLSYKLPGGAKQRWLPGQPFPQDLADWVAMGLTVGAHNVAFEWLIWNWVLRGKMGLPLPDLDIGQMNCTLARAAALALPIDLDTLGRVLRRRNLKDQEGHKLMLKMAKPRKARKGEPEGLYWHDTPENIERLGIYCDGDVAAEIDIDQTLPPLDAREQWVWRWDQTVNQRGLRFDLDFVDKLRAVAEYATGLADRRMDELTGGKVRRCTEHAALAAWIVSRGVECTSVAKDEIDDLKVAATADQVILDALAVRGEAAKSSTAKLKAIQSCVGEDQRARGLFQYSGANTRRFAGRLVQVQNLPRVDEDTEAGTVEQLGHLIRTAPTMEEAYARVELFGPALPWVSKCIRSTIVAAPGKVFYGADYSNIEGRYNAWQAGEQWKLDAFRAYDRKEGPDLYIATYAKSFNVPLDQVTRAGRQTGKVQELSMGYQGSIGAFLKMGGDPDKILPIVRENTPEDVWLKVASTYKSSTRKYGLTLDQWTAVKVLVTAWRKANAAITQSWWDMQDAAIEAVSSPGAIVPVCDGRLRYLCANGFLWYALPNGSTRGYYQPFLTQVTEKSILLPSGQYVPADEFTPDQIEVLEMQGAEVIEGRTRRVVKFQGKDSKSGMWVTKALYGGLQCENATQSGAREILVSGAQAVEEHNYSVVLHVHDELVAEVPTGFGSVKQFEELMSIVPRGFEGLPLAAKAWEDTRYVK